MRQADFVHLHIHSAFSLLQSTIRLPQLMKRARDYRLPALAITDHGNLFGAIEFYDLAYSHGIKPIIGCELAIVPAERTETEQGCNSDSAYHLVLLARNQKGYQNLLQLVTHAHARGWKPEPRISQSQLNEHHQGLVALSGCPRGEIPTWLLKKDHRRARARATEYLEVFGRENFFIELQAPLTDAQRQLNERLTDLARELDLKVVATANSHTLDPGETELLKILEAIRLGISVDEIVPRAEHSFLSPEEMKAEFTHLPEAIDATVDIAERCNLDLDLGRIHLPAFPLEKGQDAMAILKQQTSKGVRERLSTELQPIGPDYSERLEHELKIVQQLGLADYFLVISDFVRFARERGVPVGPGSGSAGSSLIAYALRITEIDPLRYDLLFERLVNPLSPEFPDIDLGFGMEMREEVHQYLRSKYGQDRVAQIVSLGTMQMRTAIRDLEKVLAPPRQDLQAPAEGGGAVTPQQSEMRSLGPPRQEGSQFETKPKLLELASLLEGLPRQVSTHATGLVIGDGPLVQRIPLYRGPKDEWVSQYNMHALKRVGLVKFDLLARKTLTVMRKTLALIDSESDITAVYTDLANENEAAFTLLCRGEIAGIPYLEGSRTRDLLLKWQPQEWRDLLVLLALTRPATLESGLTERLLQARQDGKIEESYPLSLTQEDSAGAETLLFDVDLAQLICRTTGWSTPKADQLCRILMRPEEERAEGLRVEFAASVEEKGYSREAAESIWANLEHSARLAANKSKTVAQTLTVLQAAFLKARFHKHYMASLLSSDLRQHDLLLAHVEASRQEGFVLLPPDINTSEVEFTVEEEGIRVGLAAIRQVSQATAETIVQTRRQTGPYNSLLELCTNVDREHLGKRALSALIKSGALDSFHCPRQQLLEMLPQVVEQVRQGQMALFDGCAPEPRSLLDFPATTELDHSVKLVQEKEALGFYLSGHPLSEFRTMLEQLAPGGTTRLRGLPAGSQGWLGGIVEQIKVSSSRKMEPLRFLRLEDFEGSLEVVMFEDIFAECERCFRRGAMILVNGRVVREAGEARLVADDMMLLEEAVDILATSVYLHLNVETLSAQTLRELQSLIGSYLGSCPIYLHLNIGQQAEVVQKLPSTFTVRPTREFQTALRQRFGENCLEIRYGESDEAE
jgi:DNA polymerase-3 subunit alpha